MHDAPDRAQVVKTFGKEAADFIEVAASLGWKALFNSTGTSVTLAPPEKNDTPNQRIHLSSRNKGGGLMKKYAKRLAKLGEADAVTTLSEMHDAGMPFEVVQVLGQLRLHEEAVQMEPEAPKERFVKPAAVTDAAVAAKVKKERHIISERPALMHYNLTQKGGQSYPSKTTVERRWSDGAVDYVCAVSTCGEVSTNRRAFGGPHWAMHVRKGEAQPVDMEEARKSLVDDPSYTETAWTRKQSLREKRKAELTEMLKAINLAKVSVEDLAEQIMEFFGSDFVGTGGNHGEPLTDEQVLDRIRALVDRGTYAKQEEVLTSQRKEIEDLIGYAEQRETELLQKVLEAEQRAVAVETQFDALRDLINQSVTGEVRG